MRSSRFGGGRRSPDPAVGPTAAFLPGTRAVNRPSVSRPGFFHGPARLRKKSHVVFSVIYSLAARLFDAPGEPLGLVVVEIPMLGITRRRSGHETETRVHSNHVRSPGESSRPQPNAAGDTGRCQRFVPSSEDIEPPAPVGRRRDQ